MIQGELLFVGNSGAKLRKNVVDVLFLVPESSEQSSVDVQVE